MKRYASYLFGVTAATALLIASNADAQKGQHKDYVESLQKKMDAIMKELGEGQCVVGLVDSHDGDGMDVEMTFNMPLEKFKELSPVAALEAASLRQRFEIILIWLRHKKTDRVGRVWFRKAEPLAGKYLAGQKNVVDEVTEYITWQ